MTDKSFYFRELGERGSAEEGAGRVARQLSASSYVPAPKMFATEVPPNRVLMQYQKPSDAVPLANTMTLSGELLRLSVC